MTDRRLKLLLVTPPLTQLGTPYPATPYLARFLRERGQAVDQVDLGIALVNRLFTREVLASLFDQAARALRRDHAESALRRRGTDQTRRVLGQRERYLATVDAVLRFLRHEDPSLATLIAHGDLLPRAGRFDDLVDLDWAFGSAGTADCARHLATLYLEDLTDFIAQTVSPHFQLGRYAERLGLAAPTFDALAEALAAPPDPVDRILLELFEAQVRASAPDLVGFTIPFPGTLFGALRCGQHLRRHHRRVRIAWGGGYVSTELRDLSDPRVFDLVDFVILDDGEGPLLRLMEHLAGQAPVGELRRTLVRYRGRVVARGGDVATPLPAAETGWPDYRGLPLERYLSLAEVANPMHRLWSAGRWNKLTMAHGCYWARCAFCDTTLPHIARYQATPPGLVVDRMEALAAETGTSGFHFVDEAAPPRIMLGVADELLRRGLTVSWWTNVRFERSFTAERCARLAASGCIAVSGGLEVCSDRVLGLMHKGVTVEQAARVLGSFSAAGILAHTYLMYGFPTQTAAEVVDALEVVRQLFENGLVQSAFWHRFAMTVHSPAGREPGRFGARPLRCAPGTFARYEIPFTDDQGLDLGAIGEGLRVATYNYLRGQGLDRAVPTWFACRMPRPRLRRDHVLRCLEGSEGPRGG
jgi:hypothetical protein